MPKKNTFNSVDLVDAWALQQPEAQEGLRRQYGDIDHLMSVLQQEGPATLQLDANGLPSEEQTRRIRDLYHRVKPVDSSSFLHGDMREVVEIAQSLGVTPSPQQG
jgi:hypothetical protein